MRRAALLIIAAIPCVGQAGKAELFGSVQDPSGLSISAAKVSGEERATGARVNVTTNDRGEYHLLGLSAGEYALSIHRPGFRPYLQTGITLRIGDQTRLDIKLEVGQASQAVSVNAEATLLETATGSVSFHVSQTEVERLPLDGRNFVPLIALAPGVALPGGSSLLPRINGSRPRTNEYLYDGISVLQPEPGQVAFYPVIDAIDEFRLNINAYSPEYGRSNGGTVIVNTKSGGNQLHGTLFEFFRNEDLNARNYFAPAGPKPEFRRNQYGVTVGGPIVKNKTFFFADWQGTRLRTGVTRQSVVPTLAQRASTIDPAAAQILQRYPLPNKTGANNYTRTAVEPDAQDQFDGRLDQVFNAKHRAFVRYSYLRDNDTPVAFLPDGSGNITSGLTGHALTRADSIASEYDFAISPNILNQFRFGYTRRNVNQTALATGPTYTISGLQQIGPTASAGSLATTSVTEYLDTFSVLRGRHTFKFGTDIRREALGIVNPANPAGLFAFQSFNAFLQGQVNSYSIDIQPRALQPRAHIAEFFIGDDWKVSNRLTLNIGTRYTLNFPSTEAHNQTAIFNLNTQILDFPHTGRELSLTDFGPRAGLAYRVNDSLVIRSGYGIVVFEQTGITSPFTLPQFPFVQTLIQQSPDNIAPAFLLANGPTVQSSAPNPNSGLGQGVFGTDRNVGSGYSQQWNFTVQKTFRNDFNLEVGYLGSKNTHLGLPESNLNQLPAADLALGAALTGTVQQSLRPYPRFTNVVLFRDNVGDSEYEAAQVKLEKRLSRGLTFTFAYTISKLIDDASTYFSQTIFTGPTLTTIGAADANNRKLERDVSSGDIPRIFSAGWVYQVPRWWKIAGWEVAGLVRIQSGDAVPVTQALNNLSAFGYAVQRPNRIGNPNDFATRSASQWFDKSAFTAVGRYTIGNSSRNPVRGPGLQNADIMIGKTFRITERLGLEFRAEAFNVSNTPPLNDPNGSFGSAAFGTITSAANPRDFEFAAKLRF